MKAETQDVKSDYYLTDANFEHYYNNYYFDSECCFDRGCLSAGRQVRRTLRIHQRWFGYLLEQKQTEVQRRETGTHHRSDDDHILHSGDPAECRTIHKTVMMKTLSHESVFLKNE